MLFIIYNIAQRNFDREALSLLCRVALPYWLAVIQFVYKFDKFVRVNFSAHAICTQVFLVSTERENHTFSSRGLPGLDMSMGGYNWDNIDILGTEIAANLTSRVHYVISVSGAAERVMGRKHID